MSKRQGIERVESKLGVYEFQMNFAALARIEERLGQNMMQSFADLQSGVPVMQIIKEVLSETMLSKDGEPVKNKEHELDELLALEGMQELWALSYALLSHGMIGDTKKHLIDQAINLRSLYDSILGNISIQPWRWIVPSLIFGGSLCGATSLCIVLFS